MSSFEEKLKEMEPGQIAIFALVGLAVVFLIYSLIASGSDDDAEQNTELAIPENRDKIKDYESKLDAYSRNNEERKNNVSLEFSIDELKKNTSEDKERDKLEKEVDSMLNQNKITYTNESRNSSSRRNTNSSQRRNTNSRRSNNSSSSRNNNVKKEDIDKSFDDFFKSSPESSVFDSEETKTDAFIYAVIHGDHTIKQNERVKLRLTKKAIIAGKLYDRNSYIYAFPTFQTNRVLLDITTINHISVDISAYDTEDSSLGLYVEGAKLVGEITNESTKDAIDEIDVGGVPVGTTIKKVFQKKQSIPTVTLLNNTKLILKPNKR